MDNGAGSYRRFLDGDDSGFVEIVKEYKDGLILYIDSFVRNLSVAEELTEDTFVRLGLKKPRFSGRSSFKTWLYAVGRNTAIDYLRKQSRVDVVSVDDGAVSAERESLEKTYWRKERAIILRHAIDRLKAEYRQVLWLLYFEGFSQKETATIMKKSTHNIETLAWRARQALRSELIKEGFENEDL